MHKNIIPAEEILERKFLFTENKKKESFKYLEDESYDSDAKNPKSLKCLRKKESLPLMSHIDLETLENSRKYISTIQTKKNPDLMIPGGAFLKGNSYFKSFEQKDKESRLDEDEKT